MLVGGSSLDFNDHIIYSPNATFRVNYMATTPLLRKRNILHVVRVFQIIQLLLHLPQVMNSGENNGTKDWKTHCSSKLLKQSQNYDSPIHVVTLLFQPVNTSLRYCSPSVESHKNSQNDYEMLTGMQRKPSTAF